MKLSILIPSRNEMFLARTIQDILENIEDDTEIIATLDGEWADPPVPQHERVNIIYLPEAIGQRAGTNIAAKLAKGKYIMKVDAHCSFDKGFDRKMIEFMEEREKEGETNITAVPIMRNLWAFDWKCYKCGWTKYQGPTPLNTKGERICGACGKKGKVRRDMKWIGKHNPQSTSYCFDSDPHFQYFEDYKHREPYITDKKEKGYTETMSLQGSCFMSTREKYWELKLSEEELGSWGNQGIEVACKTWLSGGRVLVNHNTWYAHMFRTQGGDFSFPYKQGGAHVSRTKKRVWELFKDQKFPHQIHPVSWLVERFMPVKGWDEKSLKELKKHEANNLKK